MDNLLRTSGIKPLKYQKIGKVLLVTTSDKKYIIKEKVSSDIYRYLYSRNFNYIPKIISANDKYEMYEYIENLEISEDQKLNNIIELLSLLHSKTTYFKDDNNEYLSIIDDLENNIIYLNDYYLKQISIIETKVYMSPSEYLLARNISLIFQRLNEVSEEIKVLKKQVSNTKKVRYVQLHNNIDLSHYIASESDYLISWNKSKTGIPIFDLYTLYNRTNNFNFKDLLNLYESAYPLLKEEKQLFFLLIRIPLLPNYKENEVDKTKEIKKVVDNIIRSDNLKLPNNFENSPNKKNPKDEA